LREATYKSDFQRNVFCVRNFNFADEMRRAVGSHKSLIATVAALLSGGRGASAPTRPSVPASQRLTAVKGEMGKSGINPILHLKFFLLLASVPFPLRKVPNLLFLLKFFSLRFLASILLSS
jgi:hypothetical protein